MNEITPENEIPPAHSTAASGTLPIEQTKDRIATIGPTTTFSSCCTQPGASVTNRLLNTSIGSSATKPAIRNPSVSSFQSIWRSPQKLCATSDQADADVSRSRQPPSPTELSCWCPVSAAC